MSKAKVQRGSATFRPRARIIRTLGRDLITNEIVALQELVKNAYDADATGVTLTFEEPLEAGAGFIEVADNGDGMTLETIRTAWMEPATVAKVESPQTRTGRRVTGEKGIGRFASARVARILDLETRARGGKADVHVQFDWGVFDDESLFLDQVKCEWEEKPRRRGTKSGTRLRLVGLNDTWTDKSFTTLRAELSRLVSPVQSPDTFEVRLLLPERFSEYAGSVVASRILALPHYQLAGKVTAGGVIDATYAQVNRDEPLQAPREQRLLEDGKKPKVRLKGGKKSGCGPFGFEFRVWDREPRDLGPLATELGSTIYDLRRDLDAGCGISIYRDRFRILMPPNDDWLRLNLRRVQNPTMRVSNNQIAGFVSISADRNPGMKDQSSRQGIVDSPRFEEFKESLLAVLAHLETRRYSARRHLRPKKADRGLFQKLDFAPVRSHLRKLYPKNKKLEKYLEETAKEFSHGVVEVQKVVARYRRLATLGKLLDVVLHEGRTPVATISKEIELLRRSTEEAEPSRVLERMPSGLDKIDRQASVLSLLFRRLEPFSGRKRGRPVETTSLRLLENTLELQGKRVDRLGVHVELPEKEIPLIVDEVEMQMIIWNLLDNALYWLERTPRRGRRIVVQTERVAAEFRMIVSDSGPGVPEEIEGRIFDPYFSSKPDGVGLGLVIVGETAAGYDGALELLADGPLPGATFRVTLSKHIGGAEE